MQVAISNKPYTSQREVSRLRLPRFLKIRWVYHTLFWIVYYALFSVIAVYGVYHVTSWLFYVELVPIYLLDIALVYFNFYVLIPQLLAKRRYLAYVAALLSSIAVMGIVNMLAKLAFAKTGSQLFAYSATFTLTNIIGAVLERFYAVTSTAFIKMVKSWVENLQRAQESEKRMLETELNFLKSQIQPHFFFNTLNNLYSLTLKKSDEAPEVVLKLSDMMSYMLYETNSPKVLLEKEITYLQNYLDIESLRFGKNLAIRFTVEGQTESVYIPPLILILFIENSFKHGLRDSNNKMEIDIALKVQDGRMLFTVINPAADSRPPRASSGIGLTNARRRLQLVYGGNFMLEAARKENNYIVTLQIPV